ncbi:hypothetical protein C0081_15525 [Cohaesibacter celericrescens]|uniref:Uncharacterized protein n=1 Tax=Cohaesibacter celericrescens TaxID=2067669 RepID=A0A2N5XP72_9HYPH|nr:hypothetical protein C0081_15525 [Cohaesibacter celericrescens]
MLKAHPRGPRGEKPAGAKPAGFFLSKFCQNNPRIDDVLGVSPPHVHLWPKGVIAAGIRIFGATSHSSRGRVTFASPLVGSIVGALNALAVGFWAKRCPKDQ